MIKKVPYDNLVSSICGDKWQETDPDGGWGIVIVKAILDGCFPDLYALSTKLCVNESVLQPAFTRLSLNGMLFRNKIKNDRTALASNNVHAWCQYAGIASGATGNVVC